MNRSAAVHTRSELQAAGTAAGCMHQAAAPHASCCAYAGPALSVRPPTRLAYRWTRSNNSWSVSLPAPSGSAGISVTQMEVADGGQTVFVLGSLLFKVGHG